jgi:hypothetical protein
MSRYHGTERRTRSRTVRPAEGLGRKLEAERIADLRQRLWSRLAGRPDPKDPTKTIQPTNDELNALIGTAIRLA